MASKRTALIPGAERVGRIFNHRYAGRLRDRANRCDRRGDPAIVDDDDRLGLVGETRVDGVSDEVAVVRIDVRPDNAPAGMANGHVRGFGRHGRRDDLVA